MLLMNAQYPLFHCEGAFGGIQIIMNRLWSFEYECVIFV